MFIIANLLFAVAQVLDYVLWAYVWIIIGRVVISSVSMPITNNPLVRFLYGATEPVLERVRRRACRYMPAASISRRSSFGSR